MKYVLSVFFVIIFASAFSQTDSSIVLNNVLVDTVYLNYNPTSGKAVYKIKFRLYNDSQQFISGYLFQAKDSAIVVYEPPSIYSNYRDYSDNGFNYRAWTVDVNRIETIAYRRKNSVGVGIAVGAGIGLVLGSCAVVIDDSDFLSTEAKFVAYCVPLSVAGAIIGAFIGSKYTIVKIEGKKSVYDNYKKEFKEFSIMN